MRRLFFRFTYFCFRLSGWKSVGYPGSVDQCVMIAAFHTSNWDFWLSLGARQLVDHRVRWLGKHTLFIWPFGPILRALGGMAVDRNRSGGLVDAAVDLFKRNPRCILVLAPEGTRRRQAKWKSGFYRIAMATHAPIQTMAFNYATQELVFGEPFFLSGDLVADTSKLRGIFASSTPKRPELAEVNFTL